LHKPKTGTPVVLLYHRMGLPKFSSLVAGQYVAPALFRSQLDHLAARGWTGVTLAGIADKSREGGYWDRDEFAVTFDDGYLSVYEHACPALVDRGLSATIYVVTSVIGGINEWDHRAGDHKEPMMTAAQVRELAEMGFEIGSHTLTHPRLAGVPDDQLEREVRDSKCALEDIVGREVSSFSYPYGDYDGRVLDAAMAAGYRNAVSTKLGVPGKSSLFEIPRVNVRWNAIGPFLMRKIGRARRASGLLD
jgi:peptidoglycan/xylan/chitin deacetylase (PgdA/CDA1 family)